MRNISLKKTLSPTIAALIVAVIIMGVIGAIIFSQPQAWRQIAIIEMSAVVLITIWIVFALQQWSRRRAGVILLRLNDKTPAVNLSTVGFAALGVLSLTTAVSEQTSSRAISFLFGLSWLSLAFTQVIRSKQDTVVTDSGIYRIGKVVNWREVATYEWADPKDKSRLLVFKLTQRRFGLSTVEIEVPLNRVERLEAILVQRAAQHGVQPDKSGNE